jgi:hypothetical protein
MNTRARKKLKANARALRDGQPLRYKIPLVNFERHTYATDQAGMEKIATSNKNANDGTALREYVDDVEALAREVFDEAKIWLDDHYNRCEQIVHEYENPTLEELDEERRKTLQARVGYKLLQRDQIDAAIYCAARVLISARHLRRFIRDALASAAELQIVTPNAGARIRPTYARFALECMEFEGKHQQLIMTLGYLHRHGGKAGRDARRAEADERRKDIKKLDQEKRITEADYPALRARFNIEQKTLKRDLDEIRGKPVRR